MNDDMRGGWFEPPASPASPTDGSVPPALMPMPTGPAMRDALLTLRTRVEQLTAAHEQVGQSIEALARNHRTLSGALNGLLGAITEVLRAQEQDAMTVRPS